jgi:adenine-specific DNA-methyltransferase
MQKLEMKSKDIVRDNIEKIAALFPNVITEAEDEKGQLFKAVDFELLKQELSDRVVDGDRERYQLTWPGKNEAIVFANMPTTKTLRPVKEDSVDWDNTENLYIEGDNLEVLKILQESYLNKIKCIYIDPPYNTGKDFVYKDNFKQSREEYLAESGQVDDDGNRLFQNTESNGRFHSDWLTMMYPRLKLAKNLLSEDGVIVMSIDDNEVHNLRKICDEVFGERNFIGSIAVQSNPRGRQSDTYLASVHDYLVCYAKNLSETTINGAPLTEEQKKEFKYKEENGGAYRLLGLRQRGSASKREDRPDMFFPIYVNTETREISLTNCGFGWVPVYPRKSDGTDSRWMWGKEKASSEIHRLVPKFINRRGEYDIFVKDYLNKGKSERTRKYKTIWASNLFNNQAGTQEVKRLLNSDAMPFPKPKALIKEVCRLGSGNNDIILDFFSGSATTAHFVDKKQREHFDAPMK